MQQGRRQIESSFRVVEQKLRETYEPIHDVRIKNEQLQKSARLFDESRAQERLVAIQQEAMMSNKKNTALEIKWSELKEHEECAGLHQSIEEQKRAFSTIISAKEKLITEFWDELKRKDDQYSKAMKEQSSDIKQLVSRMREQYFALRDQSLNELDNVQKRFESQRKAYIERAKIEVDECFSKHEKMEQSFSQNRRKAQEDFERKIDELRVEGMQAYSTLKIKMENDIQNLEKCYQEMKALYQLNTQKLDYNLKVLKEKQEENDQALEELKRKERVLNVKLRNLREDYERSDQSFKEQNKLLTAEYKRITRQFIDLQKKFKHFEKADLKKYNEIQSMNEVEVQQLKDKIVKCDQVIHSQQLGLEWTGIDSKVEEEEKAPPPQEEFDEGQTQLVITEEKLIEIVDLLIIEADFIFDDKMREELEKAPAELKLKEKLQILKKTLCIDSLDELNLFIEQMANLCKYVSEKEKHAIMEEKLRRKQEAKEEEERAQKKNKRRGEEKKVEKAPEPISEENVKVDLKSDFKVDSVLLVDFLVEWMRTAEERKKLLERTAKKSLKQLSEREKKEHIAREGKKYWQKMTQVLPDRTFRVWKVLDKSFSKYHELLLSRQKLVEDTSKLNNQNEELRSLLNQYMQINHELKIPPTRLMQTNKTQ